MRFERAPASVLSALAGLLLWGGPAADAEAADEERPPAPLVHPIWSQLPGAPEQDAARREFAQAAARYKLGGVEIIDVPAPPPSRAGDYVKVGVAKALKLAFAEALKDLDAAAAEVATTGGAVLDTGQLFDLYLYRAMATARADWNAPATPPSPVPADDGRARAFDDYLRAATLGPERTLNPRELPPQVLADFRRAVEEVRRRPRGTLTVRGSADAQLSLDGAPEARVAGGITFRDLVYGEHLIRVEEIGRADWGTALTMAAPAQELEIPERTALALDDATAAAHALRMGAKFALIAEPKPGTASRLELRLVDVMGVRHDAALVPVGAERGLLDAAVMRLDEAARRIQQLGLAPSDLATATAPQPAPPPVLLAPEPRKASFNEDPTAWARDHWPLLTASGVVVMTAILLSIVVAADR